MSNHQNKPLEIFPITPTFCNGLHAVAIINGMAHFTLYVDQPLDGRVQRIICERLILPAAALKGMASRILEAPADKDASSAAWTHDAVGGRA